jgi:DNA-directed RNA polymerase subunit H (RpoH/RPB5)
MEILFEKYTNIQKFITDYRKYQVKENFLDFASFKKTIQIEQYIRHTCIDIKRGRPVYIYIFKDQSKYIKTTPQFKRLIDKIPEEPADVIILSKSELSVYINKSLTKYPHLKIYNYLHKYFAIELAEGPLCSIHKILTNTEVRSLCSRELIIHPLSLPSISISDPQNIWIGGELGQVIKIESISEITGKTIRYRIVSPDSGKMINIQKLRKRIQDHDDAEIIEEDSKSVVNESIKKNETPISNKTNENSSPVNESDDGEYTDVIESDDEEDDEDVE